MKKKSANLSSLSDEDLTSLAKTGNQEAFTLLYERFFPIIYARVRLKIQATDVDDIAQEIFIAVSKSLHSFRAESKFSTWVRTIVNRKIADYHRKKTVPDVDNYPDYENIVSDRYYDQEEIIKREEELANIKHALAQIRPNYQEILLMRFVDNMSFSEFAQQNKQSLEATKSLFRRSISALAEKMQEDDQ